MNLILNILWFILGGCIAWASWILGGILCCITIVGIPIGQQCFKLASMSGFPFGREIEYPQTNPVSVLLNIVWIVFIGLGLAITHLSLALASFVSIIGIPFGLQYLKLVKLSLMPFGAKIIKK